MLVGCSYWGLAMCFLDFLKDRAGSGAPLRVLVPIPLLGMVGAAGDYRRANSARTAMRASVDATALAMAKTMASQPNGELVGQAQSHFAANFTRSEVQIGQISAATSAGA